MSEHGDEHDSYSLLNGGLSEEMAVAYALMVMSVEVCLFSSSHHVFSLYLYSNVLWLWLFVWAASDDIMSIGQSYCVNLVCALETPQDRHQLA